MFWLGERKMNYKIRKIKISDYKKVKKIYLSSFIEKNRFPIIKLLVNVVLKKADVFVLSIEKDIISFLYSINYNDESFILYLAVKEEYRNLGIGTHLLDWYLKTNCNKEIYLNINEVNKKYSDYELRKKRLNFYLKNNFYNTNYISVYGDSIGNILSNKINFDPEKYKLLDKKISRWFLCPEDEIMKS